MYYIKNTTIKLFGFTDPNRPYGDWDKAIIIGLYRRGNSFIIKLKEGNDFISNFSSKEIIKMNNIIVKCLKLNMIDMTKEDLEETLGIEIEELI